MNSLLRLNVRAIIPLIRQVSPAITMPIVYKRHQLQRVYSSTNGIPPTRDQIGSALLDLVTYETVSNDTLESLCEYFEDLAESSPHLRNADINYSVS